MLPSTTNTIKRKLYTIGITGGMGSGKTKCLSYLSTLPRIYTINLDLFAHHIYGLNPRILRNLAALFEEEVLDKNGEQVDRGKLGEIAFKSEYNLHCLKTLVSPEIKLLLKETIAEVESRYSEDYDIIAVEGAVLIEQRTYLMLDELWVTKLPKRDALQRVCLRNPNLTEQLVIERLQKQITDEERLKYADFHYDTSDRTPFSVN